MGERITQGMLVFDREDIGRYRRGSEPLWLVEDVITREEHTIDGGTVFPTYAALRNASQHGRKTTSYNSGWTRTPQIMRVVEAAAPDDYTALGVCGMDPLVWSLLMRNNLRWCSSADYATARDVMRAAPYDSERETGYLLGARPVTDHGLRFELGAVSMCLAGLTADLEAGRMAKTQIEDQYVTMDMIVEARLDLREAHTELVQA